MIGERLREARQNKQLSLTDVASKARISAATLSRIETEKQAIDVDMLFTLSRILDVPAEELVARGGKTNGRASDSDDLTARIEALDATGRARLWRHLATRRAVRPKRVDSRDVAARIEELLAQVDFLRQEIESVRVRLKKRG